MKALKYASQIAFSSIETLMETYRLAQLYRHSDGDYVECGVAAGAQIIAMLAGAPNKNVWAFDSFHGIPLPSNKDHVMPGVGPINPNDYSDPGQVLVSSGITAIPKEDFMNHVIASRVDYSNLNLIEGWFEDTMPINEVNKISILRLDGDMYSSTYSCLKYLFPKLRPGGMLIIDDWDLQGCREAVFDYFHEIDYKMKGIGFVSRVAYITK